MIMIPMAACLEFCVKCMNYYPFEFTGRKLGAKLDPRILETTCFIGARK